MHKYLIDVKQITGILLLTDKCCYQTVAVMAVLLKSEFTKNIQKYGSKDE